MNPERLSRVLEEAKINALRRLQAEMEQEERWRREDDAADRAWEEESAQLERDGWPRRVR